MESGVQDYESKVKRSKYEVACREQGLHFVPMVVEVFGTWGKEATPVMDFISKAVAHHKNLTYEQVDVYLRQKASIVLQRHNARALLRHRDPDAPTVDGPVLDLRPECLLQIVVYPFLSTLHLLTKITQSLNHLSRKKKYITSRRVIQSTT